MNTAWVRNALKEVRSVAKKNRTRIALATGFIFMAGAGVSVHNGTIKAMDILEKEARERTKEDMNGKDYADQYDKPIPQIDICDLKEQFTFPERVKLTWKCYVPSFLFGGIGIGSCVLGNYWSEKNYAAMETAYNIASSSLSAYSAKVAETIGEKKEQKIRDELAKDELRAHPIESSQVIVTHKGETLFLDKTSKRYFMSDIDRIRRAEAYLNREMRQTPISLNDFYTELDLDSTSVGDDLGWNIDHGYIDLYFTAQLNENDEPVIVINHRNEPIPNYDA